jgi:hypothetical protein
MAEYKPRNRNRRVNDDTAPYAWAQTFYESRKEPRQPCGFQIPEDSK